MARDAIRCYLESALKTGEPIPGDVAEINDGTGSGYDAE